MQKNATTDIPSASEILAELEAKGSAAVRKIYAKQGAGDKVFGIKMGDLRVLAKGLKKQHALGLALWDSGWFEARVLATLILDPKQLSEEECIRLAESCDSPPILDKLTDNVLEDSKLAEALCARWLDLVDPLLGRAGWNLMTSAVQKDKQGALDLDALMAKIETELPATPRPKKESMNMCLVMIGVYHSSHTDKAIAAGERLGRWDDRPVPKGCTSSYPPEWIPAAIALRNRR
ncbi:DNA alkylation repair protein [bacterium]|nr:DNA alkylation repair protein [bacterium]